LGYQFICLDLDGQVEEGLSLGRLISSPLGDPIVVEIRAEALPVVAFLPVATFLTYPNANQIISHISNHIVNVASQTILVEELTVGGMSLFLLVVAEVDGRPHNSCRSAHGGSQEL